jgi:hypothetical protein
VEGAIATAKRNAFEKYHRSLRKPCRLYLINSYPTGMTLPNLKLYDSQSYLIHDPKKDNNTTI